MLDAYGFFGDGKSKTAEGLAGETLDEVIAKSGGFDVHDFSFGVENVVNVGSSSGGLGSGRVELERVEFSKNTDTSTAALVLAACTGRHINEFHISLRKGGGDVKRSGGEFIHITMKNVVVESVKWAGADGDETLKDNVVMAFAGIKIVYMKQDMKGELTAGGAVEWNQTTNTPKM